MPARAVIFDLFGTLIDDAPPATQAEMLVETATLLGADPNRLQALWREHDIARYTGPIEAWFESVSTELGLSDATKLANALAYRAERLQRILVPRPDAEKTLGELRGRGLRLGMISNATSEVSGLWAESAFATCSTPSSSRPTSG